MGVLSRRGADNERNIAKRLNGQRTGNRGKAAPDVCAGHLIVECKERKSLPAWLHHAVQQAVAAARADQLPVVVLHELGSRHDSDLVVIRMANWQEWYGSLLQDVEEAAS